MKRYPFLIVLLIVSIFMSCAKSDIEYENDLERSFDTWVVFKKSSNNSYQYMITSTSWVGVKAETLITVRSGEVVGRSLKVYNASQVFEEWTEDKSQLNTHQSGAAPVTLDEIYQQARTELLKKRENAQTYFEAKNDGMISSAGYVEDGCTDDCFRGINIAFIEAL
jgi:hypothetical protein